MRITISGGAGYVGSRLCQALLAEGHDILVIDREEPPASVRELGIRCLRLDVAAPSRALFEGLEGCDVLIDLVGLASVTDCARDPEEATKANVTARVSLLEILAATKAPTSKDRLYIFASTVSALYDRPATGLRTDEDAPLHPRTVYGHTKLAGELIAAHLARRAGIRAVILRLANVFGPSPCMRDQAVVPRMLKDALRRGHLVIHGSGRQRRSFLYIDDLTKALASLLRAGERVESGVYNLGGEEISIRELAEVVGRVVLEQNGSQVRVEQKAERLGQESTADTESRSLNLSWERAKRAFGYEPSVGIATGVATTLDWILSCEHAWEVQS